MNTRIDHSNYEAWLLDRLEGTLTPDQERELDAFLLLHPDLAVADDELPTVGSLTDALSQADKAALKRTIPPVGLVSEGSVEDHLIARLEGDLNAEQLEALRAYLAAHPEWQRAEKTYALTKLVPEAMAFAAKRELVRQLPPQGMPRPHTIPDFLIARAEGDLSPEQERALDQLVAGSAHYQREWAVVKAARIVAEPVVYADKAALKKKEGRVIALRYHRLAIAASLAALVAVAVWFLRTPDDQEARFARVPTTKHDQDAASHKKAQGTDAASLQDSAISPKAVEVHDQRSAAPDVHAVPANESHDAPRHTPAVQHAPEMPGTPVEEPALAHAPEQEHPVEVESQRATAPDVNTHDVLLAQATPVAASTTTGRTAQERTVGVVLAGVLRERVLDAPAREVDPLDGDDAVAAVDRTLKVMAGHDAGLDLQRKASGGVKGFDLRLGRNLSISARR